MRRLAMAGLVLTVGALGGCSSADQPATVESTAVVFNAAGAPTVEFSVPDMMCEHSCAPEVRKILAAQPGVKDVKVELETKTATVAVDKDKFDPNAAVAALVDVQFKNTTLKTPGAAPAVGGDSSDAPAPVEPTAPERS